MSHILCDYKQAVAVLTLNRPQKHNAFDEHVLAELQQQLDHAIAHPEIRIILLKANGKHFSAGADLQWMQKMAYFNEEENQADARVLAQVMATLYHSPKPTVAVVQGAAMGGGAGLVAACDLAIAGKSARFCFSEIKLGLIPAVISPYVVKALGPRMAKYLFMSAETFSAAEAQAYHLVHLCVEDEQLEECAWDLVMRLKNFPPEALSQCKSLVSHVDAAEINEDLLQWTAELIAKKRVSAEGQQGIKAFLEKNQTR